MHAMQTTIIVRSLPLVHVLQGSNIMIWHVPNHIPLHQIDDRAIFKYKTTNNFLSGTLQKLFSKRYPLEKGPGKRKCKVFQR